MAQLEGFEYRKGSGIVYHEVRQSPRLFRLLIGALKMALGIFVLTVFLDFITWVSFSKYPRLISSLPVVAAFHVLAEIHETLGLTVTEHWLSILTAAFVFLVALFVCAWIKDLVVSYKIRWSRVDRWDTSGPTQYPDGYVFVANRMTLEELERVKDETTRRELRALFRSSEWRAHLRERGPDEAAYNWQKRKSEVDSIAE